MQIERESRRLELLKEKKQLQEELVYIFFLYINFRCQLTAYIAAITVQLCYVRYQ